MLFDIVHVRFPVHIIVLYHVVGNLLPSYTARLTPEPIQLRYCCQIWGHLISLIGDVILRSGLSSSWFRPPYLRSLFDQAFNLTRLNTRSDCLTTHRNYRLKMVRMKLRPAELFADVINLMGLPSLKKGPFQYRTSIRIFRGPVPIPIKAEDRRNCSMRSDLSPWTCQQSWRLPVEAVAVMHMRI